MLASFHSSAFVFCLYFISIKLSTVFSKKKKIPTALSACARLSPWQIREQNRNSKAGCYCSDGLEIDLYNFFDGLEIDLFPCFATTQKITLK